MIHRELDGTVMLTDDADPSRTATIEAGTAPEAIESAIAAFFAASVPPVPESVSPLQMRRALRVAGLRATVDAFVAQQSEEVQEAWEYATIIMRTDPMITAGMTALGLTAQQVDDLFRLAASL
jgi:hypothetical protein